MLIMEQEKNCCWAAQRLATTDTMKSSTSTIYRLMLPHGGVKQMCFPFPYNLYIKTLKIMNCCNDSSLPANLDYQQYAW